MRRREVGQVEVNNFTELAAEVKKLSNSEESWFDGTIESVEDRIAQYSQALRKCKAFYSKNQQNVKVNRENTLYRESTEVDSGEKEQAQVWQTTLENKISNLVEALKEGPVQEEVIDLPKYSINTQGDYLIQDNRQKRQDNRQTEQEIPAAWAKFCRIEPKILVNSVGCAYAVEYPEEMKVQARQHILPKIAKIDDQYTRDTVVKRFLEEVEKERRSKVRSMRIAQVQRIQRGIEDIETPQDRSTDEHLFL